MAIESIKVPDLGDASGVEVIELLVSPGQTVAKDDSLLVLESDKAAMEIPAPMAGTIKSISVNLGDEVSQGDEMLKLETEADEKVASNDDKGNKKDNIKDEPKAEDTDSRKAEPEKPDANDSGVSTAATNAVEEDINVPDLGTDEEVEVIEVHVAVGDVVAKDDSLITLESDKAAMDIPSPKAGEIKTLQLKVGDRITTGAVIGRILSTDSGAKPEAGSDSAKDNKPLSEEKKDQVEAPTTSSASHASKEPQFSAPPVESAQADGSKVYAGPAVRKLARELGVNLTLVKGSGARGRIIKEDVQEFVKSRMSGVAATAISSSSTSTGGMGYIPTVDFSQFGETEEKPLSKMHRLTAVNMHRNWSSIPHVAQFNEADVTDLELFREELKQLAEKKGVKLTFLPFLLKACVKTLQEYPQFNVSLHSSGESLVQKKYFNIGIAVATQAGLLVPVIRNADTKSVWQLAAELAQLTDKAKQRKLSPQEMQGACFTISSLGAIGGTGFTPIINAPEVAILGVGKTQIKPVFVNDEFVPRKMLPLTLSYDHRAVNGVDGGLFSSFLVKILSDIRHMAL